MCYDELKQRFTDEVFKEEKNHKVALEKAYADMSRRATGHNPQMKTDCLNWFDNKKIFESALNCKTQEEFDEWHKETCQKLKEIQKDFGRMGRSQKVINMAFKYLSCVDDTYDAILPFCHMTLDGYTLNWYKTIIDKEEQKKLTEWSKISDYEKEYYPIQEKIREYLKEDHKYSICIGEETTKKFDIPKIPFQAEFIIWEGEIIKDKYKTIIKQLNNYKTKGKKKDNWLIGNLFDDYLRSYLDPFSKKQEIVK